jgi:hypothetical protein
VHVHRILIFIWSFLQSHNSIGLVVSDKKIFKVSTNQNTLLALAAMLNFQSTPKTQIDFHQIFSKWQVVGLVIFSSPGHRPCELLSWVVVRPSVSFSHLTLLLWNRWTDFNQTCHKCSLICVFGVDWKFNMAARANNVFMTIQWTFLPGLVQICFVVSEKKMKMWNSHRVQC